MYYYGPYKESGHFFFGEGGRLVLREERQGIPWQEREIDGILQPGCPDPKDRLKRRTRPMVEGEALLHHKNGWTAVSFWDSSVDTRPGCNSTYIAEGDFSFPEMVEMAKERFAERWSRMKFQVRLLELHESTER